jgi:type IX secretion system PorP/SprF family membrane protein
VNANYYWNSNYNTLYEKTLNLTVDKTLMNGKLGIGGDFAYQLDGDLRRDNHFKLLLAYNNLFFNNYLKISAGLKGGIVKNRVDWYEVSVYDIYLPELALSSDIDNDIKNTKVFPDFDIGFLVFRNTDKSHFLPWIGLSVSHVFEPDVSFSSVVSPLPRKLSIQGGADIPVSKKNVLTPQFLYTKQDIAKIISIGVNAKYVDDSFLLSIGGMYKKDIIGKGENQQIFLLAGIGYRGFELRFDVKVMELLYLNDKDSKGTIGLSFAIK